jgi:hypothetical protein
LPEIVAVGPGLRRNNIGFPRLCGVSPVPAECGDADLSANAAAAELNARKVPTPTGRPWSALEKGTMSTRDNRFTPAVHRSGFEAGTAAITRPIESDPEFPTST